MSLQFDPTIITETDLLTLHDEHTLSEEHAVPGATPEELSTYTIPSSGVVTLREQPKKQQTTVPTGVSVVQVPGGAFTEVLSTPNAGQFQVNYTSGTIKFNATDVGKNVLISYTARGSLVKAAHINNISKPFVPFYNKLDGIVPDGGVDFTFPGDVTISGDLNISGVINKSVVEVLDFTDDILLLNSGLAADGTPLSTIGIEIARSVNPQGDLSHPQFLWTESTMSWDFNSTSGGPSGTRGPLVRVYDKGGMQLTLLSAAEEAALLATPLGSSEKGTVWFNIDTEQFMGWTGSTVVVLG